MSNFLITRIWQDRKSIVKFSTKTRFKEFFQPRAIFAVKMAETVNFAVIFSWKKPRPFPIYCTIIIHQNFYSNHFFNTRGKIEKFNLAENLQNAQKCRRLVQKTNTCSETHIPLPFEILPLGKFKIFKWIPFLWNYKESHFSFISIAAKFLKHETKRNLRQDHCHKRIRFQGQNGSLCK